MRMVSLRKRKIISWITLFLVTITSMGGFANGSPTLAARDSSMVSKAVYDSYKPPAEDAGILESSGSTSIDVPSTSESVYLETKDANLTEVENNTRRSSRVFGLIQKGDESLSAQSGEDSGVVDTFYSGVNEPSQESVIDSAYDSLAPEAPVTDKPSGAYSPGTMIALSSSTVDAYVYYTTDGSSPLESGAFYTNPINLQEAITLKAVAVKESVYSEIAVYNYTVQSITVKYWNLTNNGKVNLSNQTNFTVSAVFSARKDITTIEYAYSADGTSWVSLEPLLSDSGVLYDSGYLGWYRHNTVNFSGLADGVYTLRAKATNQDGTFTEERQFTKDSASPGEVTGLSAVPNTANTAMVLNWTNPTEDFDRAVIYRFYSYGGEGTSNGYWQQLGVTTKDNFTDTGVRPYYTYDYKVVAVDAQGNVSPNPSTVSGYMDAVPITLKEWYLNNDGVVNADDARYYGVEAYFGAAKAITSIDYQISTDGVVWQNPIITYDRTLSYNSWDKDWYRYIEMDVRDLADGHFWIQATASDADGNSLTVQEVVYKDTIADNVTKLTAAPNEANDSLVLSWTNPADIRYVEVYKWVYYSGNTGSGYWDYLDDTWGSPEINTFTDTNVYPYKTYTYKVVAVDQQWNESTEPPQVTGSLAVDGPITFAEWSVGENGKITASNVTSYSLNAYFLAAKDIKTIDYTYSTDGASWQSLDPYIAYGGTIGSYSSQAKWYRSFSLNFSGQYGLADGTYLFRATAADVDGNSFSVERYVYKDSTRPANVTGFTGELNAEKNGFVLSWTNPAEDFDYVIVQRDSTILSGNFTGSSYNDTNASPGVPYKYMVIVVDKFGNRSQNPPELSKVLPVNAPVFRDMSPYEGYQTRYESISYSAEFLDNQEITSILFEVSQDGQNWIPLNAANVKPGTPYNNRYSKSGTWDIKTVGEAAYQIRATATDSEARSTTVSRWVYIDRAAPALPSGFTAASTTNGIYLTWDQANDVRYYYLVREFNGSYNNSWYIYAPEHSYTDSYAEKGKTYLYKLKAVDAMGNEGPVVTAFGEYYSGPPLSLNGGPEVSTTVSPYNLTGTTEPGATVTVNSTAVTVDEVGNFSYEVMLNSATTTLTVAATNSAGTHTAIQKVNLDTTAPYVFRLEPQDTQNDYPLLKGTRNELRAAATDYSGTGVSRIDYQMSFDDGQTWEVIGSLPADKLSSSSWDYYDPVAGKYQPSWSGTYYWDSTVNVGVYGPPADTSYKFSAIAYDKAGTPSNGTPVRIWKINNNPPAAPANLTAVSAMEKVTLSWSANSDTDLTSSSTYRIYRSVTSGSGYVQIGSSSTTTYEDKSVQGGTTYYYVITAKDKASNEGPFSNEVSSQPLPDTEAPVIIAVSPSEGSTSGGDTVSVSVSATDNSAKGIKSFTYEYSIDQGANWKSMSGYTSGPSWYYWSTGYSGNKTWETSGLSSGNYLIRLTAADYSNNTVSVSRSVYLDVYSSPVQNLSAVPTEGAVALSWDPVADADNSGYEIHKSSYITGGFSRITSVGKDILTYKDTNVTLGKIYFYQVIAYDKYGNKSEVSPIAWSKPGDDMTPPVVTQISLADGALTGGPTITFNARATDNKAVTVMDAVYSRDGGNIWETMQLSKSGPYQGGSSPNVYYYTDFTWTTTGLPSGSYSVRVSAADAAGNKGYSDVVTWTLDKTVSEVVYLSATSGDASIKLDWQPIPDSDAGGYLISRSTALEGNYSVITGYWSYGYWYENWLSASQKSYTNTGLRPETTYYYKVISRDQLGNRAESAPVAGTTWADELPPTIMQVDPANGTTIGGSVTKRLKVYFQDNYGSQGATAKIEYSTAETHWLPIADEVQGPYQGYYDANPYFYVDWDLRPVETGPYTVRYVVYDEAGNQAIQTVNYQVDRTAPKPPQNLIATYGSGSVSLVWETPFNADVKYYKVYRANALEGPYTVLKQLSGEMTVTYADNTVQPGLTYYYKLTAVDNFEQEGEASNIAAAAAVTDDVPPSILGISPDNGVIFGSTAQITALAEDNLALSRITLEYSADQGASWNEINTIATRGQADFQWATSPLNGPVQVRAIARDSAGNLSDGNPVRSYTIDNQGPAQVTGVVYTPYTTSVLLRWADVSDADFAYFQVERKDTHDGKYIVVGTVADKLGYEVKGLKPGTEYWLTVIAYDKRGNRSTPSAELLVKTAADTSAPVITGIQPNPGYFTTELPLTVHVTDDFSVSAVTIQISRDQSEWFDLTTVNPPNAPAHADIAYKWDVSQVTEGTIYVRALAVDTAGNIGQASPAYEYRIDRTEPSAPAGFSVEASSGYMTISWQRASEADAASYSLYRSEAAEGPYTVLYNKMVNLSYRDRDVLPGKTYYYKVAANDLAGNEGSFAGPVSAQLLADTDAPKIISMGPNSGLTLPANPKVYVLASDNYRLSAVSLEYLREGSVNEKWTLIERKEVNVYGEVLTYEWNTSGLTDGNYQVRAIAFDQTGNSSVPTVVSYNLNVDPPQKPVVVGNPGGWRVDLSWTSGNEPDLAGFRLYRGTVMGGPYNLLKQTTGTSYSDTSLIPNQRYYYMVQAVDKYGNSCDSTEISAVPTAEDKIAPTAEAGDDQAATVGMEVSFDGTLSKDNDRIARYLWDFGDGSTSEVAQPVHAYDNFGTYTVALTVYDPAGNSSIPDLLQVNVMPPQRAGSLEVRVLDDVSGVSISGASVVVQYPDGTIQKTYTNGQGLASLAVLPGDYKVYGYKTDFKPASTDASVFVNQKTTATVRLKKGQLVVGELNVKRMTLDEIEAAGIDVNAPENQWVYEFEIHLAFNNTPLEPQTLMVNSAGAFLGDQGGFGFSFGDSGGEEMIAYPVAIPYKEHPEVRPTIAYMVIPGEARWLKEFFEVGLTLENTADPEFILAGSTATLRLPEGLALAPTREQQTLQIDLGEIAGGEKRDVKWIIRGDKKGEYNLEAQYDGILQPFGDPVQTIFRTKDTLKVWGDDALRMHVETQESSWRGYPYHLRLGLENVSDVPVYNAALELKDYGKQNYIYAPNQDLVKSIRELPAGETLWADYWLIPTVEGQLDLSNSYVLKTGGNANIQTDITSFVVPDEYKPEQCPVLEQNNDGFSVDLSWGPVEGAAGYRIYRVRDDLQISRVSEIVYEAGPDLNSITLLEPYGPKDYIITTLFNNQEVIHHAVTGMSWENRSGSPVITVSPTQIRARTASELLITVNSGGFPLSEGTVDVGDFATAVELDENGQARAAVTPQETGLFTVTAYDQAGMSVASATIQVLPALEDIPAIPTELRVSGFGRQATLNWQTNTEADLAGYNIYQMINSVWTRINSETVVGSTYSVTGLRFGIPYPFAVSAVDLSGNESGRSGPVSITLFRVQSTLELDLSGAAIAGQPAGFRATTVANSDVDEPVRFRITLYDQSQAQDIDLQHLGGEDGNYQPMTFDEHGVAWFGPAEGFLLSDSSKSFRVTFKKSGVYGFDLETVALYDGSVLNSVRKVVQVTGAYIAPLIRDDLPATTSAGQETAFQIGTTANSAQGATVRVRLNLADPEQRAKLALKYRDNDGTFLPLTFDEQGAVWLGPVGGVPLADAVTEMKVSFAEIGSYGYKLEIVDLAGEKVLSSSEKRIEVKTAYRAPGIADSLPAGVEAGTVYHFSVSTKANSEEGKVVRAKVALSDPLQRDKITLQYKGNDGTYQLLTFDDKGVTWFGPAAGFPLINMATDFKVAFVEPGTYSYTLEIVALTEDGAVNEMLAATTKSVSVQAAYLPPVITDTLGPKTVLGVEQAFSVSTTPNSDQGKVVRVRLTLADPAGRENISLKYKDNDNAYQPLTFDAQGVTWFGPAGGFPLAEAATEFTVSFAATGSYGYKLEIVELAGGKVLAAVEKCVEAAAVYRAPVVSDNLVLRPITGTVYDFKVFTTAYSDAGQLVRVKVTLADAGQAGKITLQYKENDGTYPPLIFDEQGSAWFGPSTGFPLMDTSTDFKVTFAEHGSYKYTLEIVKLAGGNTLAANVKSVLINSTYQPPVITDNLPARVPYGLEQAFTVSTTANSDRGKLVRVRVTLADAAQGTKVNLKYKASDGSYLPLTFDTQGVTWFGPVQGFLLNDEGNDLKVSFAEPGSYGYWLEIVDLGSGNLLAAAEKGVEVLGQTTSGGSSGRSSGGGANPVQSVKLIPAAAPMITTFSDVSANYWAENEIGYLTSKNILRGFPDGTFRPQKGMTRGELAALLMRALDLKSNTGVTTSFADLPDGHWASKEVRTMTSCGLMAGYSDGTFRPDTLVTREEVVQALYNALRYLGKTIGTPASIEVLDRYSDKDQIPEWAREAVAYMVQEGYVLCLETDIFGSGSLCTRDEVSVLLCRVLKSSKVGRVA